MSYVDVRCTSINWPFGTGIFGFQLEKKTVQICWQRNFACKKWFLMGLVSRVRDWKREKCPPFITCSVQRGFLKHRSMHISEKLFQPLHLAPTIVSHFLSRTEEVQIIISIFRDFSPGESRGKMKSDVVKS